MPKALETFSKLSTPLWKKDLVLGRQDAFVEETIQQATPCRVQWGN